jgi:uncharacterized protein YdhG (YjbR/CyaY superfamily)
MEFSDEITTYIAQFPEETQASLNELRAIIRETIPLANEIISYKMPAYKQGKVLVYFAGYKNHIGFYPTAQPIQYFQEKLNGYKSSKGAIQFPLNQALPKSLIKEILLYRLEQVLS